MAVKEDTNLTWPLKRDYLQFGNAFASIRKKQLLHQASAEKSNPASATELTPTFGHAEPRLRGRTE